MNTSTAKNWSKADLHIHTTHSDGSATVVELLNHVATRTDLKVIAITDHDTITGALEAARVSARYGIDVIVGEEISTEDGHLLGLFTTEHITQDRPAIDTIADIHAQGGIAIAPHPFDYTTSSLACGMPLNRFLELPLDGIEGFNGGILWPVRYTNHSARGAAKRARLPITGGSDSHTLATVGKGYTKFLGQTAADLREALWSNTATCGGEYWSIADYAQMWWRGVQRQGTLQYLRWMYANMGQPTRHTHPVAMAAQPHGRGIA